MREEKLGGKVRGGGQLVVLALECNAGPHWAVALTCVALASLLHLFLSQVPHL